MLPGQVCRIFEKGYNFPAIICLYFILKIKPDYKIVGLYPKPQYYPFGGYESLP